MRVIAFNGSPRKNGNTHILIQRVFATLQREGIKTEELNVGSHRLFACTDCLQCRRMDGRPRCVFDKDPVNDWIDQIRAADGIILGAPVYTGTVPPMMKAFIERAARVLRSNAYRGGPIELRRKVGIPLVATRRSACVETFIGLFSMFTHGEMIVPMPGDWPVGLGRDAGAVRNDPESLNIMDEVGRNMAWLLKKLQGGESRP